MGSRHRQAPGNVWSDSPVTDRNRALSGRDLPPYLVPAIALVAVAVCWSLQYPFWPNRHALLDQGKIVDYNWVAFATFVGGIAVWLWAMWRLLPPLRDVTFSQARPQVVIPTALVSVAFVLMYPTNAIDVYIYAVRSRLLTEYGENPNSARPVSHWETDPYMWFASQEWADETSPYGPLWNQVAAPVTALAGDNIGLAVIGFKILALLAVLGIAWLVYDTVRVYRPAWALVASLFWLWNPLVLWDGVGNAHNDVALMLPVMAALWAWARRHDNLVVPLLLGSILIKYVTLILLPLAVVAVWRRNPSWQVRIEGVLWATASLFFWIGLSLYPFYDFGAVRESAQEQGAKVSFSLAWLVMDTANRYGLATVEADTTVNLAYAVAAVGIGVCAGMVWRRPSCPLRGSFEVMFLFMLVASTNQRAWYVIWLVPLAAIVIPENPWRRTLVWSVSSMAGHAGTIWLWYVWDWDNWDRYWYTLIVVGVIFLPVLAVTAWDATAPLRSRGGAPGQGNMAAASARQTSPR